jgi:hypothetical protein
VDGALYTRLYDFDTGGENSLLTYSYVIDGDDGTTRKLPAEPWRRQPAPPGPITRRITVFQNGEGNAARVLRVEGLSGDQPGYYEKAIDATAWRFHPLEALAEPLLRGTPTPARPDDHPLVGTLANDRDRVTLRVANVNPVCSPAEAEMWMDDAPVLAGGRPLRLALHHTHTLVKTIRPVRFWTQGTPAEVQAALVLPDWATVDDPAHRARLRRMFERRRVVNALGTVTATRVSLDEIRWTTPFRVPAREKAMFNRLRLRLSAPTKSPPSPADG